MAVIKAIHLVDIWEGGELSKVISYYARFALSFAAIDYIFFIFSVYNIKSFINRTYSSCVVLLIIIYLMLIS